MSRINISDFTGTDDRARFAAALDYMKEHPGTTLFVEPGKYLITSEKARWAQESVMKGDFGANPEPIMFNPKYEFDRGLDFSGHQGSRVEAYGATLMIDGFMEPISIRSCSDVEICGLTVDHMRKPYSKGVVFAVRTDEENNVIATVKFPDYSIPMQLESPRSRTVVYDPKLNRFNVNMRVGEIRFIEPGSAEVYVSGIGENDLGCEIYFWHTFHSRPAIFIEQAKNTVICDVTIHSAPGMGITAQQAKDILVERLRVIPSVGEHMSTNTDATHFASCRGKLRLDGCIFEGQGDDSVNVHTYYYTVKEHEGTKACLTVGAPTGTHGQVLDYPIAGDTIELTEMSTLNPIDKFCVVSCEPDFENYCCNVVLDRPLPENLDGLFLADADELPELEFVNCDARNHLARSIMIKCRRALVENCTIVDVFDNGIKIAAEAWWYEGISTDYVTVRRCRIINCGRQNKTCGGISVYMDCSDKSALSHGLVVIEDNIIECPEAEHAITVSNTHQLQMRRNCMVSAGENVVIGEGVEIL